MTIWHYICLVQTADVTLRKYCPLADLDVNPQIEQVENLSTRYACELQNKYSVMYVLMNTCQDPKNSIWGRFFFLNPGIYFDIKKSCKFQTCIRIILP